MQARVCLHILEVLPKIPSARYYLSSSSSACHSSSHEPETVAGHDNIPFVMEMVHLAAFYIPRCVKYITSSHNVTLAERRAERC